MTYRADWHNPEKYPPINCTDHRLLAWEFLRRNQRYGLHSAQMLQLSNEEYRNGFEKSSESCLDGQICNPSARPGETARKYYKRTKKENGVSGKIIKPWKTFQNEWLLGAPVSVEQDYNSTVIHFFRHAVRIKRDKQLRTRNVTLLLFPNEILVRFRLDLPLNSQLDIAKQRLVEAAKQLDELLIASREAGVEDREPIRSLRNVREKAVMEYAHFWLRSYDALTRTKKLVGPEHPKFGEAELIAYFKEEGLCPKAHIARGVPDAWRKAADSYINDKKYMTLLADAPVATRKHNNWLLDDVILAKTFGPLTTGS